MVDSGDPDVTVTGSDHVYLWGSTQYAAAREHPPDEGTWVYRCGGARRRVL
jgi:hypothetical protein